MPNTYIAYFRVSTQRQGRSGLGLNAQRSAVSSFCSANDGNVIETYTEVESGRRNDRPMLSAAIAACENKGATLLIAKLDRLARRVHFISGLLESSVKFTAVDMPNADRFMLHVYAAMAEEEARRISERTKCALAAAKRRGVELGKYGKVLAQKNRAEANRHAREVGPRIDDLRRVSRMSYRAIADQFNLSQSFPSARGGKWHESSVYRTHKRFMSETKNINFSTIS